MIIDFKKYSSVKIGKEFEVELIDEIKEFDGFIVGGANNLLVSNEPKKLGLLSPNFDFINILEQNKNYMLLDIGCATKSSKIYSFAKKYNLKGFEFLCKIPGTLGGLIKMNAGLKDEVISKNLLSIKSFQKEKQKEELDFAYRYCGEKELIFSAKFKLEYGFDRQKDELLRAMRDNQPSGASFGSIFKNPPNDYAGRLIEAVGLKGFAKNDAMFSQKHANFLINKKNASFEDAIFLIEEAEKRVFESFGINLQREVVVI